MKKLLLTTAATCLTIAAFGQGQINFNNASTIAGWTTVADRNVKFDSTASLFSPLLVAGANVSSNYAGLNLSTLRAALYFAPTTVSDPLQFTAAGGGPVTFKVSTSTTAGSWFGGTRTLDGIPNGTTANLVVFVWDSSRAANPLDPQARFGGGLYGQSAIFQYTPPSGATPAPAEFLPNNLMSFGIGIIPEPSSFALVGLGAAAMLIFRRRK
jgi:hypothetical protein